MRDGDWKLVQGARGLKDEVGLYHLVDDIGESQNVAAKHPEQVERMLADLNAWKTDVKQDATIQPTE